LEGIGGAGLTPDIPAVHRCITATSGEESGSLQSGPLGSPEYTCTISGTLATT
jgi:hypothetical protein